MSRPWKTTEIAQLREHYPTTGLKGCLTLFPDRSEHSIRNAVYWHGIHREGRVKRHTIKPIALKALEDGPITSRRLAKLAGCTLHSARVTLSNLRRKGIVQRLCMYRLTRKAH